MIFCLTKQGNEMTLFCLRVKVWRPQRHNHYPNFQQMPSKGHNRSIYSMGKDVLEGTMGVYVSWTKRYGGWEKSSSLSFLFKVFPFVRYKIPLRFIVLYSILFHYLYCFFFAKKTISFQTLLKGTFSLLTCHLQFSITARVSMTLKRQSVQRLSDHKTARAFCARQEHGIVERIVWSKANGCSLLSGAEKGWGEGGGGRVSGEGAGLGKTAKDPSTLSLLLSSNFVSLRSPFPLSTTLGTG